MRQSLQASLRGSVHRATRLHWAVPALRLLGLAPGRVAQATIQVPRPEPEALHCDQQGVSACRAVHCSIADWAMGSLPAQTIGEHGAFHICRLPPRQSLQSRKALRSLPIAGMEKAASKEAAPASPMYESSKGTPSARPASPRRRRSGNLGSDSRKLVTGRPCTRTRVFRSCLPCRISSSGESGNSWEGTAHGNECTGAPRLAL